MLVKHLFLSLKPWLILFVDYEKFRMWSQNGDMGLEKYDSLLQKKIKRKERAPSEIITDLI